MHCRVYIVWIVLHRPALSRAVLHCPALSCPFLHCPALSWNFYGYPALSSTCSMVSAPACRKVVPRFESRPGTLGGSLLSNSNEEKQVLRPILSHQHAINLTKKHAIAWSRPTNYFHFLSVSFLTGQYLEAVCQILQCCRVPVSLWGIICVLTKLEGKQY